MKVRDKSRKLVCTDKENTKITGDNFHHVFNRESNADWEYVNKNEQKKCVNEFAKELLFPEFNSVVNKLVWHKNPGFNGVSSIF